MTTLNNLRKIRFFQGQPIEESTDSPAINLHFYGRNALHVKKKQLYDVYQQRSTRHTPHKNNQWEKISEIIHERDTRGRRSGPEFRYLKSQTPRFTAVRHHVHRQLH
ncbi:hypothetical protein [Pseudomonas mandelii]|uniref:hypothetical protein n=1 Tax=Pseudomonas mandelii TaxID=75612 RepID=UPI00224A889C|nr:hypothetical protein [Pseudomonas mandelii]MCX2900610.1 hypothetical protein [Pseudomonas mandelii]